MPNMFMAIRANTRRILCTRESLRKAFCSLNSTFLPVRMVWSWYVCRREGSVEMEYGRRELLERRCDHGGRAFDPLL